DKWQFGLHMEGTNRVAIFSIGTDKARHGDSAAIGKKLGYFADAANVLFPIGGGEAKVLVKPVADIIAVENISQPATLNQSVLQGKSDGALSRAAQARKPEGSPFLAQESAPLLSGYVAFMPGDVGRFDGSHGFALI